VAFRAAVRRTGLRRDWLLCLVIAGVASAAGALPGSGWSTLSVFALENLLLVSTAGTTVGKRLLGLKVVSLDGGTRPSPLAVVTRTVLLCLAVPALVWDRDGRGLHDKAARTAVVRT
jgi:uncharacterized RDD family membrane protein YckC